jgi:hypothetical protein
LREKNVCFFQENFGLFLRSRRGCYLGAN